MIDRLRSLLLRLYRVPPPPDLPSGRAESARVFRAAPGYFRYRLTEWGLRQLGALAGIVFGLFFGSMLPEQLDALIGRYVRGLELLALGLFAIQLVLSYAVRRLDYELRWYAVTDRSLRVREGIFRIREQTVSFANVQNVSVRQGPLQRFFGIADLEIRTAGGGGQNDLEKDGKQHDLHKAVFRGVDDAESLRDRILRDLRRLRDAGLGDEKETESAAKLEVRAATALEHEARALRRTLEAAAR